VSGAPGLRKANLSPSERVSKARMRRFGLTCGAVVTLFAAGVPAAGAQTTPAGALAAALNRGMGQIGGSSGAYVTDLQTGQVLFSDAAGVGRIPASVEKIYTTSTALLRWGPSATLSTTVLGVGTLDTAGGWQGTLYLRGGGDPTFGAASFDQGNYGTGATVQRLVSNLVRGLHLTSVQGGIVGDESYFDSLRSTSESGFQPDLDMEGTLSALAYDRGFASLDGSTYQRRPALVAAQQFAAALRRAGVRVPKSTPVYTGRTPSGAQQLAVIHSPPMAQLIQLTNTPSDNFFAEMLLKGLGASFGGAGTSAAGAAVVRSEVASQFGIHPHLVDGSGLSYADSTSPLQVVTALSKMYGNAQFVGSLAIGGETGTLQHEMQGTAAQGNCHAKTGTLIAVANLAGYCRARDGHTLAFAFLANGVGSTDYAHLVEANRMAVALAKYNG
jgi:D-alanyl-D-alanine carboxypeptidase/D-alanyl-D-alanine-endopeptidase (penicillin-binding protein 4)